MKISLRSKNFFISITLLLFIVLGIWLYIQNTRAEYLRFDPNFSLRLEQTWETCLPGEKCKSDSLINSGDLYIDGKFVVKINKNDLRYIQKHIWSTIIPNGCLDLQIPNVRETLIVEIFGTTQTFSGSHCESFDKIRKFILRTQ